jgi:3-oxoacyl-[acyl-carrier-protein] synthase II
MKTFPHKIMVTGLGAITPLGETMAENWRAVLEKRSAIAQITRFDLGGIACQKGGIVPFNPSTLPPFNPSTSAKGGLASAFAITAVREAILEAGVDAGHLGLITGSNFGEADSIPCDYDEIARRVASALGLGGPVASLSLSCASGASAIAMAADWIACGHAEAVAVVGVDAIFLCSWSGLCSLRTMARDAVVRPFDATRGGTVFAEGAAAVVLEREDFANAHRAPALAELRGWATGNNGFHLTAPPPRAAGSRRVMNDAIAAAEATPSAIDFVTAHATATKANDLTEAQALEDIFGEGLPTLPVTAVKAASGHLLGAAGAFEAAITVLALREQIIPPIARTPLPDPEIPPLNLVTDTPRPLPVKTALTDSAGFGGCNAALVFSVPNRQTVKPSNRQTYSRIAICSSGFISALGIGSEEAEATWAEGESACFPSPGLPAPEGVTDDTAGVVPPFEAESILPTAKAYLDRQSLFAMSAAALALQSRKTGAIAQERFGVSHGTAWGAAETLARFWADCREKGPRLVKPMLFPHTYANAAASLISMEWELRGFHANFAGGQNASSFALAAAVDALRRGEADAVLAGGSEALSPDRWASLSRQGGPCPPGEGAAFFVLRRASELADGETPLALLAGVGFSGEGDTDAAIHAALDEAELSPADVGSVFASPGLTMPALLANRANGAPKLTVAEEMTGSCDGASAAIQLACALLEPLPTPTMILTRDDTGTCVALAVLPWPHQTDNSQLTTGN